MRSNKHFGEPFQEVCIEFIESEIVRDGIRDERRSLQTMFQFTTAKKHHRNWEIVCRFLSFYYDQNHHEFASIDFWSVVYPLYLLWFPFSGFKPSHFRNFETAKIS